MTDATTTSTEWATFEVEREWPVTPERVFHAFSDAETKAQWFGETPSTPSSRFDFRTGGSEYHSGADADRSYTFDGVYLDIVENQRVAYSYQMFVDGVKLSVSLTVVTIEPTAAGTKVLWREAAAFFDDTDNVDSRREGTEDLMDKLGELVQR